jgi:hypothetical protein
MRISKKIQVIYAIVISIISYLVPFILYQITGTVERSISAYHETNAETALLVMLLLISSSFFTGLTKYKIAGVLLILVALINIDYGWIHDLVSGIFFVYIIVVIFFDKRFYLLSIPMAICGVLLGKIGLYAFEMVMIYCIASFAMLYGLRYLKLLNVK